MMKKEFVLIMACFAQFSFGQTTVTLQPGAAEGKDAFLDSRVSDYMGGDHHDFLACSWTHGGSPVDVRSIVEFDLSSIPADAFITSATLYLYGYDSPSNTGHASLGDGIGNQSYVQRITSDWSEATVSWDSQPSTTEVNQVMLDGTLEENLNYEVDVKELVEDMILFPEEAFGFMLRLVNEETYNSLLFASSDNGNSALHPKLVVVYEREQQSSLSEEQELVFSVYPNPTNALLRIDLNEVGANTVITVYSSNGEMVYSIYEQQLHHEIDVSNWAKGTYVVQLQRGEAVLNRKLIIG